MNIFLTGASGFVGGAAARRLAAEGHRVRAMSRSSSSDQKIRAIGAEPVRCDLDTVIAADLRGAEIVISQRRLRQAVGTPGRLGSHQRAGHAAHPRRCPTGRRAPLHSHRQRSRPVAKKAVGTLKKPRRSELRRGAQPSAAAFQLHPQSSQQALPLIPSIPSLVMIGTITSPATGSAHHQPSTALRSKPPNRIADK